MKHPSRVFALILLSALVCAAFVPLAGARSTSGGTDAPGVAGGGAPMNTAQSVGPTVTQYAPVMVGPLSPYSAAYDSTNKLVYVADANSPYFNDLEGVTAINGTNWANTFQACTGAGNGPQYLAHDPANNDLYVSCIYPGNVVVINPKTDAVVATVGVGSSPGVVAYDPADQDVYVANYGSNTVSVISSLTNTVVATVATGQEPTWITYSPTNKDVYVIDTAYPYGITVIDGATNALVTTISGEASNAIYDPTSGDIDATVTAFVSGVQTPYVYVIGASNTVAAKILLSGIGFPEAEFGGSLAYDSGNGNVFVGTDPGTTGPNVVSEVSSSTDTVVATVNVPADCTSGGCYDIAYLAYAPANGDIYVSGPGQYVYIVSSSDGLVQTVSLAVIASGSTSDFPTTEILNPSNNEVYVLCSNYAYLIIPLSS